MPLTKTVDDRLCCLASKTEDLRRDVTSLEDASADGNATLVGGTVTVANTNITAASIITVGRKTIGGTAGNLSYTLNPGVGFTLNSSSGTDTSVLSYHIKF